MPDDYWDEPRFHPEHLDDNQNSNPGKQRVEPLLKDGDVVDRLKQFRLRWQDSGDLTYLGKALVDAIVEIEASRKASAPAPASGGVDAVKLDKAAMDWAVDCAHTAGVSASRDDVIGIVYSYLSALSPAATPVSEDEPGATVRTIQPLMCEAVIDFIPKQNGHLPFDVGSKLYALAKPASSPAGWGEP